MRLIFIRIVNAKRKHIPIIFTILIQKTAGKRPCKCPCRSALIFGSVYVNTAYLFLLALNNIHTLLLHFQTLSNCFCTPSHYNNISIKNPRTLNNSFHWDIFDLILSMILKHPTHLIYFLIHVHSLIIPPFLTNPHLLDHLQTKEAG